MSAGRPWHEDPATVMSPAATSSLPASKRCSKCGEEKPLDAYHKNKKERYGVRNECKACRRAFNEVHQEERRVQRRRSYERNAETVKAKAKEYRESNKDRVAITNRRWVESNRDRVKENLRQWRAANAELVKEKDRQYRQEHAAEKREYERRHRRENPGWEQAKRHKRRARKKMGGRFTAQEWNALCAAFDHRCLCCGEPGRLTADHIVPLVAGGANTIDNIQPLCMRCNVKKGTKTIDYRPGNVRPPMADEIRAIEAGEVAAVDQAGIQESSA